MRQERPHSELVDICVCTCREFVLVNLLRSLQAQKVSKSVQLRIVVVDNDTIASIADIVAEFAQKGPWPVQHIHTPDNNSSAARNAALAQSDADWMAFIDDEIAPRNWVAGLLQAATNQRADVVIAPVRTIYSKNAPDWAVTNGSHANTQVICKGQVKTGHTCNALVRWKYMPWRGLRFDRTLGQSGGEYTVYFSGLKRCGARMVFSDGSEVFDPVDLDRLSFNWLLRRRFRSGQSHAAILHGFWRCTHEGSLAALKVMCCLAMSLALVFHRDRRTFWLLRAALHLGVLAGLSHLRMPQLYER